MYMSAYVHVCMSVCISMHVHVCRDFPVRVGTGVCFRAQVCGVLHTAQLHVRVAHLGGVPKLCSRQSSQLLATVSSGWS